MVPWPGRDTATGPRIVRIPETEVVVRRRICLLGAALAAPLAFGVAVALAKTTKAPKAKTVTVTCRTQVGIMVGPGDISVFPPVAQGKEYGSAVCGKLLGSGVQSDAFTVPDSGDSVASYKLWLPTGTIHGTFDLTPQEGSFIPTSFSQTDYLGTLTVTGGTGLFKGARGTGTSVCTTPDGIHTTCTDKFKFTKL